MGAAFDLDAIFGDDYLTFHEHYLTEDQADSDVEEILRRLQLAPGARVLDVPCGTGRLLARLGAAGFAVTGLDRSGAYLDLANKEVERHQTTATLVHGDMEDLSGLGSFDAIVCWFNSFGYLVDPANEALLARFASHLVPGGMLLIDTLHHDGLVTELAGETLQSTTTVDGAVMVETMDFNPVSGSVVTERIVTHGEAETVSHHVVRLPTIPEWISWLTRAGFSQMTFTDRGGAAVTKDTFELVVSAVR